MDIRDQLGVSPERDSLIQELVKRYLKYLLKLSNRDLEVILEFNDEDVILTIEEATITKNLHERLSKKEN